MNPEAGYRKALKIKLAYLNAILDKECAGGKSSLSS